MSVVRKYVNGREYVYLAYRQGGRVVHKYLGTSSDQEVVRKIQEIEQLKIVPAIFSGLFWDADSSALNLKKNSKYIIERVLELGDLKAVAWIERLYPGSLIIEVLKESRKISKRSRNFWSIWFGEMSSDAY